MFIIITGAIGVGKSTICRKLIQIIQTNGLICEGILTFKSAEGDIIIEDIRSGKKAPLAKINNGASDGPRTTRYLFNQSGINFGIQALHKDRFPLSFPSKYESYQKYSVFGLAPTHTNLPLAR